MVAYGVAANMGNITVSGLGATWTHGYAPPIQSGVGLAFFYGSASSGTQSTVMTITVPNQDNLSVFAEDWSNLSVTRIPEVALARAAVAPFRFPGAP